MGAPVLVRTDALQPLGGRTDVTQATAGRWTNTATGRGGDMDRHAHTRFDPAWPLTSYEIDALIEFEAVCSRIVSREPDDAIRAGIEFDLAANADPEVDRRILAEFDRLDALEHLADARRWARAYGGGAIVVIADDGVPHSEPLDLGRLRRVVALETVDRYEIDPVEYRGLIQGYRLAQSSAAMFHPSRVIPFHGTKLSRRVRRARKWWGGSVLDLVWSQLRNWADAHEDAREAITLLSQGIFKSKHLASAIDGGDIEIAEARIDALRMGMGLLGDIVIDAEHEEYDIKGRPVSGVGEVLDRLTIALVAATDMPRAILLGETPGGLNAGENAGEIRSWYDHVQVIRGRVMQKPAQRILDLVLAQAEGPTAGQRIRARPVWPPLWQESDEVMAKNRLTRAQARALDKSAGVLGSEELRQDPDLDAHYEEFDPDAPPPPEPAAPGGFGADQEDEAEAGIAEAPMTAFPGDPASPRELAARWGFKSPSPFFAMARRGEIGAWKVNGRWRFSLSQVEKAIGGSR